MAYSRGYHNYRGGRRAKGKVLAAVLLVLVILGAVAMMFLQNNMSYDDMGKPHFNLPGSDAPKAEENEELPEVDLVIQNGSALPEQQTEAQPQPAVDRCAFSLSAAVVNKGPEAIRAAWTAATADPAYTAAVITVKDGSDVYLSGAAAEAVAQLAEESSLHTVARLSCFHDPKAANRDLETMGLKNTGGYIFYDGNNSQWLDPAKSAARAYLCDLARQAAELGVDEICLTDVSYPTVGKLDKVAYGSTPKEENLTAFLREMAETLKPYGTALSIELPETVVTEGADEAVGLSLQAVTPLVDTVYCTVSDADDREVKQAAVEQAGHAAFVAVVQAASPAEAEAFGPGSMLIIGS